MYCNFAIECVKGTANFIARNAICHLDFMSTIGMFNAFDQTRMNYLSDSKSCKHSLFLFLDVKDPSLEAICLMRVLYYLNSNWGTFYEVCL